ncbi:MAG TPA: cupin domain-containing protein [Nitrososphaeraceae archaeon]|nr:cupin domain-containing protein [Nitrososphaeraceae archaeon]
MILKSSYWINELGLSKHPEGGYFREIYRSPRNRNNRALVTSIYYLLDGNDFSSFHKIDADEIWHFYYGSTLTLFIINERNSRLTRKVLGNNYKKKENFEIVIESHNWLAAQVNNKLSYSLVGCTVIPGFEFDYYELGERDKLFSLFPEHKKIIEKFTRE